MKYNKSNKKSKKNIKNLFGKGKGLKIDAQKMKDENRKIEEI